MIWRWLSSHFRHAAMASAVSADVVSAPTARWRPQILRPVIESLGAIVLGLLLGGILMLIFGYNPIAAYLALLEGAFGSGQVIAETLSYATPLMLTAITFAVGVRAGLFNIGAEGQVFLGAIGTVIVAGWIPLPPGIHIIAALGAGMLFGVAWAIGPALLKSYRGVHEVISTIMFNWIAFNLTIYLAVNFLAQPGRAERTRPALETARLPIILEGSTLTGAFLVAVAFCLFIYFFLWGTRSGYELRLAGENPDAARFAGVNAQRTLMIAFILGGMAAGLAGATQIIGRPPAWSLYATLGNVSGMGFDGLGVALIGRNHPIGIILAAIFYGALQQGGRLMEYEVGVASEMVRAINGLIIIALSVPEIWSLASRALTQRSQRRAIRQAAQRGQL